MYKSNIYPIALIQFINYFINGALTIIISLYMLEQKISLESIGLVFALLPFVFLFFRMGFAAIGDEIGTAKIFELNGLFNFLSALSYSLALSPVGFAIGKLSQGLSSSTFWAVARTDVAKMQNNVTNNIGVLLYGLRSIAHFSGCIIIGFTLYYLGFQNSLFGLALISLIIIIAANFIKNDYDSFYKTRKITKKTFEKIFERKSPEFWKIGMIIILFSFCVDFVYYFILLIYARSILEFSYMEIGTLLAIFSLFEGTTAYIVGRLNFHKNILFFLTFSFMVLPLLLLGFVSSSLFWIIVMFGAIGSGFIGAIFETLIYRTVAKSKNISIDIGVLHIPIRISEIILFAISGFIISMFGYQILFISGAVSAVLFIFLVSKAEVTNKRIFN